MPRELLTAGMTTTILTYKSQGSVLSSYLRKLSVPVEVANDNQLEASFRSNARDLITIKDIPSVSRLSLSYTGQLACQCQLLPLHRQCIKEPQGASVKGCAAREHPHHLQQEGLV